MKKWSLFLGFYLCICILAACGASNVPTAETPEKPAEELPTETVICRVVGTDGTFLLAKQDGSSGDVYDLPEEFSKSFRGGELVEVTWSGDIQESFPAELVNIVSIKEEDGGFDDLTSLYLHVLEDLWKVDPGLNESGVEYVVVDLSQTSLSDAERSAVTHLFAGRHDAEPVSGTWNELVESGDITAEPLSAAGAGTDLAESQGYFYQWKNGCHFSIQEKPVVGSYNLKPIAFDAQKWRSSLGAYYFGNCTSVQSAAGAWGGYQIGSELIS